MELSLKDRLILVNQCRILEALYPEEADYYQNHREALESGYQLHYSWAAEGIDKEEMSEAECRKVLDVLGMYRAMTFSYRELEGADIEESEIRFRGYDGNYETKQFAYTNYFVVKLGRFKELTQGLEYPDFNSHSEMIQTYERMLSVWNQFPDKNHLTADQIKEILNA